MKWIQDSGFRIQVFIATTHEPHQELEPCCREADTSVPVLMCVTSKFAGT